MDEPRKETTRTARPAPAKGAVRKNAAKPKAAARPERPRGGQARAICDLMPDVGRSAFRRFGFIQSSIVTRWPEIVGAKRAQICAPESIRFAPGEKSDGVLQLVVVPAHAPLISHVLPDIVERVNRFFGYNAVARAKLRQGEVTPRPYPATPAVPPMLKPIPVDLGDSLRDVGDPELRAVLESLARSLAGREQEGQE